MDGLDDVAGREIIGFQEVIRFPRFAEAVLDADEFYWDTAVLGQGFADGPSQTAHDLMFFTDDDGPRFSRTSTDRIQVQRFDRVVDIVSSIPEETEAARNRYRIYLHHKYPLKAYDQGRR